VTLIVSLNKEIENPAVVPTTLRPNGGEIWVAAEGDSAVYSVDAKDNLTTIASIDCAENVTVIPTAPTNLGSSGGSYFAADFPTRIVEFPGSDFFGLGGNVLVGSEFSSRLSIITLTNGKYQAKPFQDNVIQQAEGAAFVQILNPPFIYAAKFVCGRRYQPEDRHHEEGRRARQLRHRDQCS